MNRNRTDVFIKQHFYEEPIFRQCDDAAWSKTNGLGVKQTLKLAGVIVTPTFPFKLGNKSPGGSTTSNECAIVAKNKNISIFAKTSPKPRNEFQILKEWMI